jgi:hypothetical protein
MGISTGNMAYYRQNLPALRALVQANKQGMGGDETGLTLDQLRNIKSFPAGKTHDNQVRLHTLLTQSNGADFNALAALANDNYKQRLGFGDLNVLQERYGENGSLNLEHMTGY